jgi:biopolymer transport protein ExbD
VKKHKMPEMKEGGVNVTPLIDIVMCLIIFFMLVAKIGVTRGVDAKIKLPDADIGNAIKEMGQTITLNIHHLSSNATTMVGDKERELSIADHTLEKVLKEFRRTHTDKATAIVRGDEDLEYHELEPVLMAIANAGISDTAYEIKPAGSPKTEKPAQ